MSSSVGNGDATGSTDQSGAVAVRSGEYESVRLITLRMQHHAGPSGYDSVAGYIGGEIMLTQTATAIGRRVILRALNRFATRSGTNWYGRDNLGIEIDAALQWLRQDRQMFHFLYGENSYRYLGGIKRFSSKKNWLTATFHTPEWKMQTVLQKQSHLLKLDAAIAVSTSQLESLTKLLGQRVHYVPHGIDTEFFSPEETDRQPLSQGDRPLRLITVGQHLRDFDLASRVMKAMEDSHPLVKFILVANPKWLGPFEGRPNVECYSRISDEELLALYRSADVLFLPLTDSTANNSLLEGMACGLPIITTDLVGTRDYVTDAACAFVPKGDYDFLMDVVQSAIANRLPLADMGQAARSESLAFSWTEIAAQLHEVYSAVSCD